MVFHSQKLGNKNYNQKKESNLKVSYDTERLLRDPQKAP
jgi:hypothetical protein